VRDESEVLLVERRLLVLGTVAASTYERIKGGLPARGGGTTVCCFVGFAYADLPIGKTFDRVFSRTDHRCTRRALSIIRAVTQQFGQAFDEVPHGWKTICLLDFPDDVPDLIRDLPVIASWYDSTPGRQVELSSDETWTALIDVEAAR